MKSKPLKPTLRENKRYLVFDFESTDEFNANQINNIITDAVKDLVGNIGLAKAGLLFLNNKYDFSNKNKVRGIVRVTNTEVDSLKASIALINKIDNKIVKVTSVGTSGILKKAIDKYYNTKKN
jgi:RNase P/RNase MRP subunit POP5